MLPIPGIIQSKIGQGFEQPDLTEDGPAQSRGFGPDDFPTQITL